MSMKAILFAFVSLSMLTVSACGSDSCEKLTKDICSDDKECAKWVKGDLMEGSMDKQTCDFLTGESDYKVWLKSAKESYAEDKAKAKATK